MPTALTSSLLRSARPSPTGLALGVALDRLFGDPARYHPVAGLGRVAAAIESRLYADTRVAGVGYAAVCIGAGAAVGVAVGAAVAGPNRAPARVVATALSTWAVLGGTSLDRVGAEVAGALADDDTDRAREYIPSLCARDPRSLDGDGICRAATESVAENTSDAAVAPLLWGGLAGIPGLIVYRTVNTLDAMVGYRNARYNRFGWACARVDDLLNLAPARVAGALVVMIGPDRRGAARAWHHSAARHPSPNAGVVEASFAGALGISLGGRTIYPHGVEERPQLGVGNPPTSADLIAAVRLSGRVQAGALGVAMLTAIGITRRRSVR